MAHLKGFAVVAALLCLVTSFANKQNLEPPTFAPPTLAEEEPHPSVALEGKGEVIEATGEVIKATGEVIEEPALRTLGKDDIYVPALKLHRLYDPVFQSGSWGSVLKDNGPGNGFLAAFRTSKDEFVFSDTCKPCIMPLAIVGRPTEIVRYFAEHPDWKITNQIEELPEIYMGFDYYSPKKRYEGLFPFHDALVEVTKGVAGFAPGSVITDVAGIIGDLVNNRPSVTKKSILSIFGKKGKQVLAPEHVMVVIHYLRPEGISEAVEIAKGTIAFKEVAILVRQGLMGAGLLTTTEKATEEQKDNPLAGIDDGVGRTE